LTGKSDLEVGETVVDRDGTPIAATLMRPRRAKEPLPAWVILHGITRPGRAHTELVRFTRALTATKTVAIVPEVPEWRELDLSPGLAAPTVAAALNGLRDSGWALDAPVGVVGFSFGAPHAIAATGAPELVERLAGSVAFGGYYDLARTCRFMITGRHEWQGKEYYLPPDPYGRWIVAANYLTATPGREGYQPAANALRRLAAWAGDLGAPSWDPCYDPFKVKLRFELSDEHREVFDLIAPMSTEEPNHTKGLALAEELIEAAHKVDPAMEPAEALEAVNRPVHILHGRKDHLIPFSESLRLQRGLPPSTWSSATVTALFGHSAQDPLPSLPQAAREVPVFLRALNGALGLV
jgi:pimeloyl-ACP methyl ester carboxylesterase